VPGFSDRNCKPVWLSAPEWQPLRKLIEKLLATRDWAEINIVVNCLLDPIVSTLFLRELVLRSASLNGDAVTSVLIDGTEYDREIRRASTKAFVELVIKQNSENKAVIEGWLLKWLPLVLDAAQGFEPLFALPFKQLQSFDGAYGRVIEGFDAFVQELGLTLQAERPA